ncbi:hypothetical protein TSUD_83840 [Trifolium subterraneum]|uniref:BZIP domain-containing protein n=1 Tax=Trifolium subterraneum TaxID=3900 RepID=A0A2Z6MYI8_TRISU|nr:hypothetical protein TSUD_83840 [Trifolium subterraneum]
MDEIPKNIYPAAIKVAAKQPQQSTTNHNNIDDVWTDIVAGGGDGGTNHRDHQHQHHSSDECFSTYSPGGDGVTLEDFLVRAGAVPAPFSPHHYPSSDSWDSLPIATLKRNVVEETLELDKAVLQKHRRMIKNRESAARHKTQKVSNERWGLILLSSRATLSV